MKRLRFLVISFASICNKFAQRFYRKHEVSFFGNDSDEYKQHQRFLRPYFILFFACPFLNKICAVI